MITTLALAAALTQPTACQGAQPAITNVTTTSTESAGVTHYTLTAIVSNLGPMDQSGNDLQSVDIFLDGAKNGEKGIPPLHSGQLYSFVYNVDRNPDAAQGSTDVRLHLVQHGSGVAVQNCAADGDRYEIKI
jgi:subtilase family serine protease